MVVVVVVVVVVGVVVVVVVVVVSAFVGYEEFCRSQRVLSTSAFGLNG